MKLSKNILFVKLLFFLKQRNMIKYIVQNVKSISTYVLSELMRKKRIAFNT